MTQTGRAQRWGPHRGTAVMEPGRQHRQYSCGHPRVAGDPAPQDPIPLFWQCIPRAFTVVWSDVYSPMCTETVHGMD